MTSGICTFVLCTQAELYRLLSEEGLFAVIVRSLNRT